MLISTRSGIPTVTATTPPVRSALYLGSSAALESLEPSFHQDLNGDGVIGVPTTTIEALGSTSLVQVGSNYFLDSISSGTGPALKLGGANFVSGQLGGWTPIGAEQTSTGYEVALKYAGADQYTIWNTDSNGNYASSPIGAVSGSSAALESLEPSFHQDLNGDGVIGVPTTTIEALGSTSLVQVGSNYFLDSISSGTGPALKLGGANFVSGQLGGWTPIGAEQTSTGYEVALKYAGADQYTIWDTDSNGNYVSSPIGVVSGISTSLESLEPSFHQDLNGDGAIGVPAAATMGIGAIPLTSNFVSRGDHGSPSDDIFVFGPAAELHFAAGGVAAGERGNMTQFGELIGNQPLAPWHDAVVYPSQVLLQSTNEGNIALVEPDSTILVDIQMADLHQGNFIIR